MTEQDHKLGEVLRAAREAKEIDLIRVERDTKIRERYLSALERGEYRELPGAVYTKGFLRNYGAYLGLDPEYLIDLYRLETSATSAERQVSPSPPRPITVRRRRTFVVTPGAVAAAILTILVGAFVAWLGYEFVNFARTPELRIIEPAGDVSAHTEPTITIRGITAPDAEITVSGLPENPSTTADADGNFEMTVGLLPGSNEIHLVARDPVTNRSSEEFVRRVNVMTAVEPSPTASVVPVTLDQPQADASVTGAVPIAGTAAPGEAIELSAVVVTAATPTFSVTGAGGSAVELEPAAPAAPEPVSVTADAAGAFSSSLSLPPGTWDIAVTSASTEPITRRVTVVPGDGLTVTLRLDGGSSYLELEEDGVAVSGVSGGISDDGERVNMTAEDTIRILAGNAGAVRLSVNGIGLGVMGDDGAVIEWQIARSGD
ncbi:MAG TPA: helix-turn-helix domain-containing protein [Candidatus Limnocylindrales bacterium]|nr:helix-turn-helix domain-containing protein [Candidatus Limnocylindrales bacterium]